MTEPESSLPSLAASLTEALERAAGPDHEIDKQIYYEILGFCPHANTVRSGAQSDTGFDCVDCGADSWGNLGKKGQRLHDKPPTYTGSLDSALTLVPEGWRVEQIGEWYDQPLRALGPWLAILYAPQSRLNDGGSGGAGDPYVRCQHAATAPLALASAALRAHLQERGASNSQSNLEEQ